jgi:hypothetical protein
MNTFRSLLERFFPPHQTIPAGIYPYSAPPETEFNYRWWSTAARSCT